MNIKLSKNQWNFIGKKAGWLKEAQLPSGQSKLGMEVARSLNVTISRMGRPDLETKARALASQLISLFDQAAQQEQNMDNFHAQQNPQQPNGAV